MRATMMAGLILAATLASGARAAEDPGFKPEYRLSEQEKERILAAAATAKARTDIAAAPDGRSLEANAPPVGAGVHGEIGFGIGTGGYRSVFGTGAFPLGDSGGAMITFDIDRFGDVPQR